eukprot:3494246-Prorocentrum_lima.AAC.1
MHLNCWPSPSTFTRQRLPSCSNWSVQALIIPGPPLSSRRVAYGCPSPRVSSSLSPALTST